MLKEHLWISAYGRGRQESQFTGVGLVASHEGYRTILKQKMWKDTQTYWVRVCSVVSDFPTPRTVAHQAPLPMGFSRQEYWSGFAISSSRGSSRPRMELLSPALQADSLPLSHQGSIQSYLQGPLKARPLAVEPMLLARFSLSLLPVTHCSGPLTTLR